MLNEIDTAALDGARDAIRADPPSGIARYEIELDWAGGTRCRASTKPMMLGDAKIAREFSWAIDEPPELLGQSAGPTPQEYLMSGVGACIMVGFVVNASVKGIKLKSWKVGVKGTLDLAGFLNLRPDAEIKMSGLDYLITVDADASRADLEEVAAAALSFSPNAMTVKHGTKITGALIQL